MDTVKVCNVKVNHTMRNVGVYYVERCQNPCEEGQNLCLKHLKKRNKRLIKWGDRKEYSPITEDQMKSGVSFKLADTHEHRLFRLRKNIIQIFTKNNGWVNTEMPITPALYCRKRPYDGL